MLGTPTSTRLIALLTWTVFWRELQSNCADSAHFGVLCGPGLAKTNAPAGAAVFPMTAFPRRALWRVTFARRSTSRMIRDSCASEIAAQPRDLDDLMSR